MPEERTPTDEFAFAEDSTDDKTLQIEALRQRMGAVNRQAILDPDDGLGL